MSSKQYLSRRTFLKESAVGLAGAALVGSLTGCSQPGGSTQDKGRAEEYYTLFGVDEDVIRRTLAEGLSGGGDFCDIFFQKRAAGRLGLEDNAVNAVSTSIDCGVGIRVIKGDRTGYSFTEQITPEAMRQAARTAAGIADSGGRVGPQELKLHRCQSYYAARRPWEAVDIGQKIAPLQQLNDAVFAADRRIVKCQVGFTHDSTQILIANSEGLLAYDSQPMSLVYLGCVAEQSGRREDNYAILSNRCGAEFFDSQNIDELARTAVRRTVELFDAVKPAGGQIPVVLAPGKSGILLHEAIGHGMEADFNRKGESTFSDKLGRMVAAPFVSIVDDGTVPGERGAINIDDEGNDSQKTYMVRNGRLESYLHDRISAAHYGLRSTGNGRRESFRFVPQPRMRCTYMENGPHDPQEIIKSVKYGLYAEHFSNGQVMIGAGDFSFYVKSGRLIENGKLTRPVKDINIIGNGPKVLNDIVMVGSDFDFKAGLGCGTCGKNGQGAPVSMGLPTVKIAKITIGSA